MNLAGIISISGKPGLYKVLAQGKNNIIVESLKEGKKSPAYSTDKISALEDISIYTYEEDVPLKDVYAKIYEKENGGKCPSHKESLNKLEAYLGEILPNYDADRVYPSDIKKLFQWYNLLHDAGALKLEEEEEETKEKDSKETKDTKKGETKKADSKPKAKAKTPAKAKTASKPKTKTQTKAKTTKQSQKPKK